MPSLISGWPNFARVGGDDEVAHHRQLAAAAERKARHGGDHRLANRRQRLPVARDVAGLVDVHVVEVGHRRDVGAGGKRLLAAGDDDAADAIVAVVGLQRRTQVVHQRVVQRVELLRAVQRDDAGAQRTVAMLGSQDVVVGHGAQPARTLT